ncbi:MAG TPA: sodium:solute symporter [Tepidisphaeraceae bacterium]|nr:sodium:solute symporter [Tepidisphaeraceae bacterium]
MALLVDGLIIVLYFVAIIWIGLYMGRREKSLHDFALGGRNVPWWAVMASIIAAETSAATFIGTPEQGYTTQGLVYVQLTIGLIIGRVIVGYVFLKPYFSYKVYTVYDYLGVRFGPASKNYVSALFLIMRTLASGVRLLVPALVMVLAWRLFVTPSSEGGGRGGVEFSQTSAVTSVAPYVWAICILTVLTCLYTAIGGIKAVIWTDVIQATLMFGSAIVAAVTLLYHIGGDSWNLLDGFRALGTHVPTMTEAAGYVRTGVEDAAVAKWQFKTGVAEMRWWNYVQLVLDSEFTIFSAILGATAGNMAAFGTDQDMVQRMLTAQSYQKGRRSLITAALMDVPVAAIFSFIGVLLIAYYQQNPTLRPAATSDVFGAYILNGLPVVVRGLVLAGLLATAMGSLSAALNSLATSFTNDWYIPYMAKGRAETHYVAAARLFTAVFAGLMVVVASGFAYAKVTDPKVQIIPVALGIGNFILGPMLGVFALGMFTRNRGSDRGNLLAITAGLLTTIVLGGLHVELANLCSGLLGSDVRFKRPIWLPRVAFTWFALVGATAVFLVGMLYRTPPTVLEKAKARAAEAAAGEDRPIALRG